MKNEDIAAHYEAKYKVCLNWIAEKIMEDSSLYTGIQISYEKALDNANSIVEDEMKWREVNENMASTRSINRFDRID